MTESYPLQWPVGWPRAAARARAQFNRREVRQHPGYPGHTYTAKTDLSVYEATKRVLYELERLGVRSPTDLVISTNLVLRRDGLPRSDQREPIDPGAAVYWRSRAGVAPMRVMAIDRYDRVADNLAAIAATLEAMRAIERHGGAQVLERAFTGFDALPPPMDWRAVLGIGQHATLEIVEGRWRELAARHHPDRPGGSEARMAEINAARDAARKELT